MHSPADPAAPAIDVATIGGRTIRFGVGGARHAARTLLVFNGIGASIETLAPFMAAFRRTRVLSFDVPGVGGSPASGWPYRLGDVARLAAGLLDHLALAQVHVMGVSWGGAAAQEFALRHPQRLHTLTLGATTAGFVMVPGHPGVLLRMIGPRRYLDPAYLMRIGGTLYGGALRDDPEALARHAESLRAPSRLGYLHQLLAVWGWTSWHRLHRIEVPALVLMGEDDPIVPAVNGRILAARLRHASLETVPCGHLFVLTRAEETARRVEGFISDR